MKGVEEMNGLLEHSKLFLKRNASTILTCVGGAGVVATSIMAVKATPKALVILEEAKEEKGEELTRLEKVKIAGPAYIPAVVTGAATIACIFGANILNQKQQAALMSAYALLDNSYKEYREKVEELYGEGSDREIKNEIAKDHYKESDIFVSDNKRLFYDEFSERYFEASTEDLLRAENEINKLINTYSGAFLNEYYELIGLEPTAYGDYLGWSSRELYETSWSSWLDLDRRKVIMDDGLECTIISFRMEPTFDFENY
jgi:hypothetical protein